MIKPRPFSAGACLLNIIGREPNHFVQTLSLWAIDASEVPTR